MDHADAVDERFADILEAFACRNRLIQLCDDVTLAILELDSALFDYAGLEKLQGSPAS